MTAPIRISPRLSAITPSLTLACDDLIRRMNAGGRKVINLTVGQPDFDTPEWILKAADRAMTSGFTRYTSPVGTLELRTAATAWLRAKGGADYGPEEILVSSGSKHSLYNILQAIIHPGEEVIVPAPYWVSYPDLVLLAGGVPVHPRGGLETAYKMTPDDFGRAISPRTRAVIFNSPSNPTGAVYTRDEARALARIAIDHDLLVISDEIYDRILYDGAEHVSFASLLPGMRERTFTVNGVSKAYAMTGWRIGFAAGPGEIIRAMGLFQGQATGNPSSVSQAAALAALTEEGPEVGRMVEAYARRRGLVIAGLAAIPHLEWVAPMGAFYFFIRARNALGKRLGDRTIGTIEDLTSLLIERGVGVVPGTGFGSPEAFRLSFAASDDDIRQGLRIIRDTLIELK